MARLKPPLALEQDHIDYYRYLHIHGNGKREPRWRGTHLVKYPNDLLLYAQVIFKRTPQFIVETGTHYGGSALFFGDMLELTGGIKVFSIDIVDRKPPKHPKVEHVIGSSIDPAVVDYVKAEIAKVPGASVMASLDSNHRTAFVFSELMAWKDVVTPLQYMVVEDSWTKRPSPYHPYYATIEFLRKNRNYRKVNCEKQFKYAVTKDGWLFRSY